MAEHMDKTVTDLMRHVDDLEQQVVDSKRTVNSLCKIMGRQPVYGNVDPTTIASNQLGGDEYHGRPLARVVREILEHRRAVGTGPIAINELFEVMLAGGYEFTSKKDEIKKRGLAIALAKNSSTFYKLPNGKFGLLEWYPNVRDQRQSTNGGKHHGSNGKQQEKEDLVGIVPEEKSQVEMQDDEAETPTKPR